MASGMAGLGAALAGANNRRKQAKDKVDIRRQTGTASQFNSTGGMMGPGGQMVMGENGQMTPMGSPGMSPHG